MIADLVFGPPAGGLRRWRRRPRASIPLEAACLVAAGIRETLRELLGERCELVLGEPAAIDGAAWSLLAADAFLFLTRGRQTDIVLVLPQRDARRLVLRAFGESEPRARRRCPTPPARRWRSTRSSGSPPAARRRSTRSAPSAAAARAPCAGRRCRPAWPTSTCASTRRCRSRSASGSCATCPSPARPARCSPGALDAVALEARAVFAEGTIDAAAFVRLRPGDLVRLETQVGAPASLKIGGRSLATGLAGVVASRHAFLVHDVASGATP